jgi:Fe-S cluster assembly protein SufD
MGGSKKRLPEAGEIKGRQAVNTENTEQFLSDFTRFEHSPPAARNAWFAPVREAAIARFAELGFPTTRLEEWRYTSVAPIARVAFSRAARRSNGMKAADLSPFTFGDGECSQLVFLDGHYSEQLSSVRMLPKGVRIRSLAAALETDRNRIEPHLARVAGFGEDPFTALNTAFLEDGAFVCIPPAVALKQVLHIVYLCTAGGLEIPVSHPRNLIVVGNGSQATIVQSYVALGRGVYFTNAVTEVVAGHGSVVDLYKLQRESEEAFHIDTLRVTQERDSSFSSHSISLGGAIVRNNLHVSLDGEGADCVLNGLYVAKGRQHVDNHTAIDHAKPHCTSRELYKGIMDDRSTGVFNGRVLVRKDAQKTNAKQTNKNLLLSREALVNTNPELQIYADDVKCTHGATIGQLDEEALFYLRSRGLDEASARVLLTYAFANDLLGSVKFQPMQCQLDLVLLNRLSRAHEHPASMNF